MAQDFLDNTKNKRKQNYDFLSRLMKEHQINVGTVVSPQQSIVTSQMTDQVIRIVNSKPTIPTSPSENTPLQSPKALIDETPIIQEIDNMISKIKSKSIQASKASPIKKQTPLQIEEPQEDFMKQIREKNLTLLKKQESANPPRKQLLEKVPSPQFTEVSKPPPAAQVTTQARVLYEESPKRGSAIKEQVLRLRETFKPPIAIKPEPNISEVPIKNVIDSEQQIEQQIEQKNELITTSQFNQFFDDSQSSDYITPIKRMDVYSQLSYSQSVVHSVPQSEIKNLSVINNPALEQLIQEEQFLLQRLHILQQQLKYEQKRH